jgi:hypothetical protein
MQVVLKCVVYRTKVVLGNVLSCFSGPFALHLFRMSISDKQIIKLWRDPNFLGSYRGVKTFQLCLKTEKNIDVSAHRLYKLLRTDNIFLLHQTPVRNFPRRVLNLNNYGELVFGDIAFMYEFQEYKYFLLVVDGFSSKTFVRALKTKDSKIVALALEDIFKEFKSQIYVFETDRGTEFQGASKKLFKKNHIIYKSKYGINKAFMAENYIRIIKKNCIWHYVAHSQKTGLSYLKLLLNL